MFSVGRFCLFWAEAFAYFKHEEAGLGPKLRSR